jgi:hypothetical protein
MADVETAIITGAATLTVGILTVAGGMLARWREQQQANKRPFLEKQLELCFAVTDTASRLAIETDPMEWEKARLAFWRLYWGPLSIVENRAVEAAMVELGDSVPKRPVDPATLPMTELQVPAYRLAHAARDLVLRSWNVDLPALGDQRQ